RQRRAASSTGRLCEQVLRQVRAPDDHRRDRGQPATGNAGGVRAGHSRRRRAAKGRKKDTVLKRWRAAHGRWVGMTIVAVAATRSLTAQADRQHTPFVAEIHAAMQQMMTAMDVTPTGDVDADFAAMMIPHHVGAIAMARAELKAGRNEQLRRLAQEIIVTQQQEIAVMRLALTRRSQPEPGPRAAASPSRTSRAADGTTRNGSAAPVRPPDRLYAAEQFSNTRSVP